MWAFFVQLGDGDDEDTSFIEFFYGNKTEFHNETPFRIFLGCMLN